MADGRTHFAYNALAGAVLTGATFLLVREYAAPVGIGCIIGLYVTPDWDLTHQTETERRMAQLPILGFWFRLVSGGYGLLCKRHRGVSHKWLLGTLSRVLYLGVAYWVLKSLVVGVIYEAGGNPAGFIELTEGFLANLGSVALLMAWWMQDFMHYRLDNLPLFY